VAACAHCGTPLAPTGRVYCGPVCKKRAWRRRRAGLPEDAFPLGFAAGRRSLRDEAERREADRAFLDALMLPPRP